MAVKNQSLRFRRTVNAPPVEVFRLFTHGVALRDWLCAGAHIEPRKGGRLCLWWENGASASGEIAAFEPGKKLTLTWRHSSEPEPTKIRVALAAKGPSISLRSVRRCRGDRPARRSRSSSIAAARR